jgi:putative endonuclease
MTFNNKNTGERGEDAAERYLRDKGYDILERNFQNNFGRRLGEIDIIAFDKKKKELVFVEVKTREYSKYRETLPEENITMSKMRKLSKIAEAYLRFKRKENEAFRFDAVSVWLDSEKKFAKIKHIISL